MDASQKPVTIKVDGRQVTLRVAEPEDRPRANAVQWSVGWTDPPARNRVWPEADAEWQAGHYYREIVAEVEGVIAARIGLEAYRQPFAEMVNLCVRHDYRRLGLGEHLTRACQREAAQRGFAAVFLQTEIDNLAAHRLYTGLDFVPTAYGKMLRMVKFLDYPLVFDFKGTHPLSQYACTPAINRARAWNLEWHAYVTNDYLRLLLEGGASQSDSMGLGPSLSGCDWRVGQGARDLSMRIAHEDATDLEPGHYVALSITICNAGRRPEAGVIQMALPPGVRVDGPSALSESSFAWEALPGEEFVQPIVVHLAPTFDARHLWYLNYPSLPISAEVYWEGHRALLSASLPMAVPPPQDGAPL
jgi:ribosomal protein S18 acetylase RimI-like enzyme